jgi:hypothetical protein
MLVASSSVSIFGEDIFSGAATRVKWEDERSTRLKSDFGVKQSPPVDLGHLKL